MAVEFTRTFDVKHDVATLVIEFDNILNEYPSSIVVKYYGDGVLLDTQLVENISDYSVTISSSLARDVDTIVFTVLSLLPNYRVRVNKVGYYETDFTVDFNSIKQDTQKITKLEKLKNVNVNEYSYASQGSSSELFKSTTTATTLHAEFGVASNVSISVSGGSLVSSQIYGQAADMVLSSGTKTVTITGIPQNQAYVTHTYNYNAVGDDDNEENPLITSKARSDALAEHVSDYLKLRDTYDFSYRGNPELETGDIIGVETDFASENYGLVLKNTLSFGGAWSGTLTVKGLN